MSQLQMRIRDVTTNEEYRVDACENTVVVKSRKDGVKIKLHPVSIRLLVKPRSRFSGHTLLGQREMELLA
jgi:hypothetical protein